MWKKILVYFAIMKTMQMINGLYILECLHYTIARKNTTFVNDAKMIKAAQLDGFLLLWYDQCDFTIKQSQHYFLHWTDVGWQHLEMLHVVVMVRHALTRKLMNSKLKITNQKGRWSVIFPSYSSESFTFHEHIRRLPLPRSASVLNSCTTTNRG